MNPCPYLHAQQACSRTCPGLHAHLTAGSVREGLHFLARTIVQRTQPGLRQSVKTEGYLCHVHVRDFGLAGIVVADQEYPTTAAFSIITKVLDEFILQSGDSWQKVEADSQVADPVLEPALVKYQVRC